MNKVLGTCACPLPWCGQPGAEVREGEKGTPYVVCDDCGCMIRTTNRKGKAGMRALVAAVPALAPAPEPKPAPPAKKKASFGFFDA